MNFRTLDKLMKWKMMNSKCCKRSIRNFKKIIVELFWMNKNFYVDVNFWNHKWESQVPLLNKLTIMLSLITLNGDRRDTLSTIKSLSNWRSLRNKSKTICHRLISIGISMKHIRRKLDWLIQLLDHLESSWKLNRWKLKENNLIAT